MATTVGWMEASLAVARRTNLEPSRRSRGAVRTSARSTSRGASHRHQGGGRRRRRPAGDGHRRGADDRHPDGRRRTDRQDGEAPGPYQRCRAAPQGQPERSDGHGGHAPDRPRPRGRRRSSQADQGGAAEEAVGPDRPPAAGGERPTAARQVVPYSAGRPAATDASHRGPAPRRAEQEDRLGGPAVHGRCRLRASTMASGRSRATEVAHPGKHGQASGWRQRARADSATATRNLVVVSPPRPARRARERRPTAPHRSSLTARSQHTAHDAGSPAVVLRPVLLAELLDPGGADDPRPEQGLGQAQAWRRRLPRRGEADQGHAGEDLGRDMARMGGRQVGGDPGRREQWPTTTTWGAISSSTTAPRAPRTGPWSTGPAAEVRRRSRAGPGPRRQCAGRRRRSRGGFVPTPAGRGPTGHPVAEGSAEQPPAGGGLQHWRRQEPARGKRPGDVEPWSDRTR